jgi:hypothetical protein
MADSKIQTRSRTWHFYEPEVAHYFQHEEGARGAGMEPASGGDPREPRFPIGANYWTMMTVIDRLAEADRIMPCAGVRYRILPAEFQEPGSAPRQEYVRDGAPSCRMVLGAAYGTKACRYDDQAPGGARWLRAAKEAYMRAAATVPARRPPNRSERLLRQLDRLIESGEARE